ncbi:MAG: TIGR02391 family protein [Bacteroidetes bacterium]|mgnify:CR=1 FL=1|nr:TIGR02391 family protein [Bacteroidota bacterium]
MSINIKDYKPFSSEELENICKILADTNLGFTGSELSYMLKEVSIADIDPNNTKWRRLFNAFVEWQNKNNSGYKVLSFIAKALSPKRFVNNMELYRAYEEKINPILAFYGLEIKDDGKFYKVEKAKTLTEVEMRVNKLRKHLEQRNVDPFILKYCNAEIIKDNYFHGVLEATKGVASLIRQRAILVSDGAELVDEAFGGSNPILKINKFVTDTEKSEQRGFVNLAKGMFGTFRNPTAHAPKIEWNLSEQDALDLFSLASYICRRIQNAYN